MDNEQIDEQVEIDKTAAPGIIKPIEKQDVHRICSGQVVLNLAVAVKELVENSLDAGATIIEIRLKEYGKDSVEVSDNGSGVREENFAGLTLKHHTSKLRDFSDLLSVSTYGFRGEALSSLCSLSDLSVLTRHRSIDLGSKILYDHMGCIKSITPHARQIGTTVTLRNLFSTLPVRQKEFHRNFKRDFNKMIQILYAYCLVCENIKITCSNQTSSGKSLIVATQGSSLRDNIASIFGIKQLQTLIDLKPQFSNTLKEDFKETLINNLRKANSASDMSIDENDLNIDFLDHEIELSEDSSNDIPEFSCDNQRKNKQPFNFNGYISTCLHGSGRSTGDRQFFYINSRPCEPKKVIKVCNEIYKQYNPNQFPFVFLNILLKKSTVDVNVTPDKRKVFFDKEKILIEVLKHSLNKIFENIPSTVKFNNLNIQKSSEDLTPNVTNPRVFSSFLSQFSKNIENTDNPSTSVTPKRKSTTIENFISISKVKKIEETLSEENNLIGDSEIKITDDTELKKDDDTEMKIDDIEMKTDESEKLLDENETKLNIPSKELKHETVFLGYSEENDIRPSQVVTLDNILSIQNNINKSACFKQNSSEKYSPPKVGMTNYNSENHTPEKCERLLDLSIINTVIDIPGKIDQSDPSDLSKLPKSIDVKNTTKSSSIYKKSNEINISLEEIKNQMFESFSIEQKHKKNIDAVKFRSEINPKNNKQCEEELQKEISKNMFNQMNIIGQFNLGFIITQLNHDLFIIDQHATDEKYNFEELQNTTILSSQKLVIPQVLQLTGVNERILIDSIEIFRKNGFDFIINEEEPPTKRVKLSSIPYSKNWMFGKEDIDELLFMLNDAPNELCRPSRIRAMFASRACRKSVMIGTALSKADMRKLVDHMGTIEQPWNCPHGRPTIRHLVNLGLIQDYD